MKLKLPQNYKIQDIYYENINKSFPLKKIYIRMF
jgi:hypothetical protein